MQDIVCLSAHAATWAGGDYAGADIVPADGDIMAGTFTNVGAGGSPYGKHDDSGFPADPGGAGSGGGSGGSIVLDATTSVQVRGVLAAPGGRGGETNDSSISDAGSAGGGSGGRIKIYGPVVGDVTPPWVAGGSGGPLWSNPPENSCSIGDQGGPGTVYVDDLVAGPPSLTVTGTCGSVSATVTGGTPFGWVQSITGELAGSGAIPDPGICAGVATGMAAPARVGTRALDETGSGTWRVPAGVPCGELFQVVDLWSCTTSPVVTLP